MRYIVAAMLLLAEVAAAAPQAGEVTSKGAEPAYACLPAVRAANPEAARPYWQAKEALNREDYSKAAVLFGQAAEAGTPPAYGIAHDALYWQAFALYRLGTEQDLQKARVLLDKQSQWIDGQNKASKVALAQHRGQTLASYAKQRRQLKETLARRDKQYQEALEAQQEQAERYQAELARQLQEAMAVLEEQSKQSGTDIEPQRRQYLESFEAQQVKYREAQANLAERRRQSLAALAQQNKQSLIALETQKTQSMTALDEQEKRCRNVFDAQYRQSQSLGQRIAGELARRGDSSAARSVRDDARGQLSCDEGRIAKRIEALTALSRSDPAALLPILQDTLKRHDVCFKPLRERAIFLLGQQRTAEANRLLSEVERTEPEADLRRAAGLFLKNNARDRGQ